MTRTQEFQRQVELKMNEFFRVKIRQLRTSAPDEMLDLETEYNRQFVGLTNSRMQRNLYFRNQYSLEEVLLGAIAEPTTCYTLDDLHNNGEYESLVYSPRIDIGFSPIIKRVRGRNESIGVYRLTTDVRLYQLLHRLAFVKEIENQLRAVSNRNLDSYNLQTSQIGLHTHNEEEYINKRPLYLFGIEIENQTNIKYLMGDFLNAISLARVPIVIVPESCLDNLMNMLRFCKTINNIKEVPIYDILTHVSILTVSQFRDVLNILLTQENIRGIADNGYR